MLNQLAHHHSATSFLNSLLLEWKEAKVDHKNARIPLGESELVAPLKKFSLVGRHQYEGKFFLKSLNVDLEEITFPEVATKISDFLALELETPNEQLIEFTSRVKNSILNLQKILEYRESELKNLNSFDMSFERSEQLLYAGHTFHPTPKARSEFSDEDAIRFSPEFKASFPLTWIIVHKSIYSEKSSKHFTDRNWLTSLFQSEVGIDIPTGFVPFPIHPFQVEKLFSLEEISEYKAQGLIRELETPLVKWIPTSSVRTLYRKDSLYMLKFSLSVKLTNSMRNLLAHELDRGLVLHDIFHGEKGQKLLNENPCFRMVHEPVFCGLIDKEGNLIQESLVLGRINDFRDSEEILPVATLCMNDLHFRKNLVQNYISAFAIESDLNLREAGLQWFKTFLSVSIAPLIRMASNYGLLLGAHQQNMLVKMENNLPVLSYFRDCNGTGFTHEGAEFFNASGIVVDKEAASFLFGYYVIINTTFNVLASIAHGEGCGEDELLEMMRSEFLAIKAGLNDSYLVDYLLNSPELMHKGNFLCSFQNINENTQENPLSIYTSIKNPLRANI